MIMKTVNILLAAIVLFQAPAIAQDTLTLIAHT